MVLVPRPLAEPNKQVRPALADEAIGISTSLGNAKRSFIFL
jgi:hypothetical protein